MAAGRGGGQSGTRGGWPAVVCFLFVAATLFLLVHRRPEPSLFIEPSSPPPSRSATPVPPVPPASLASHSATPLSSSSPPPSSSSSSSPSSPLPSSSGVPKGNLPSSPSSTPSLPSPPSPSPSPASSADPAAEPTTTTTAAAHAHHDGGQEDSPSPSGTSMPPPPSPSSTTSDTATPSPPLPSPAAPSSSSSPSPLPSSSSSASVSPVPSLPSHQKGGEAADAEGKEGEETPDDTSPSPSATIVESTMPSSVITRPSSSPSSSPETGRAEDEGRLEQRRYTEVDCREHGTFCIYTNVCYDGEKVVMLVEDSEIEDQLRTSPQPKPFTYGSTKKWFDIESVTYSDVNALLPRNQRFEARTLPASVLFGKESKAMQLPLQVNEPLPYKNLAEGEIEYIWLDGSIYLQSADTLGKACRNPWHWSLGTIPLWTDQFINETLHEMRRHSLAFDANANLVPRTKISFQDGDDMFLPSMDYVLSLCEKIPFRWGDGLLRGIVPPETKIISESYLKSSTPEPPAYTGVQSAVEKVGNLGLAPNRRLLCTDKAVLHTSQYTLFNTIAEWRGFRKKVLNSLGLDELASQIDAPPKVVFKATGRTVTNMRELLAVCRKYTTCEMTSKWSVNMPFETQVREVASAGILVGAHGAGLTNAMFLPPYGALIELFGYKWWPDMYRRMANEMGIAYYAVTNLERPNQAIPDGDPCIDVTALRFPYDSCTHRVKNEPFSIPVDIFEVTLVNALQQIGVNALPPENQLSPISYVLLLNLIPIALFCIPSSLLVLWLLLYPQGLVGQLVMRIFFT